LIMNTTLRIEHIPPEKWWQRARWRLTKPLDIVTHIIPQDFVTDGVSTPLLMAWLVSPTGKAMRAAVLHDYLLSKLKKGESRKSADKAFFAAMQICDVSYFRASMMYGVVRVYGLLKMMKYMGGHDA